MTEGYLEIILGGMYAGKTSRLIQIHTTYSYIGKKIMVINYAEDKRYHDSMVSAHDGKMIPCVMTLDIHDMWFNGNHEYYNLIHDAEVILINEGQFFIQLYDTILSMVETAKKRVYICGLDGDFKRQKFGELLDLVPHCDKVEKLTALCAICRDGKKALFSKRVTNEEVQVVIGSDNYIPVCRMCYNYEKDFLQTI